jgi:hypothetical protein
VFVIFFHFSHIHLKIPQRPYIFIFTLQLLVEMVARSSNIQIGLRTGSFSAEGGFVSVQATDAVNYFWNFLTGNKEKEASLSTRGFLRSPYES